MAIQQLDLFIILVYLLSTVVIGLVLNKRAKASKESYLLGGNSVPWYMLALSNASGMFDISGTMWMVSILFIYGLKSVWLPWLWPVFNQVFLMVYLSIWLRRSNATTGAEWIKSRFGGDKGAELSHLIVVIFAIINCLGFMAYGFVGLGKFVELFIPWSVVSPYVPFDVAPAYVPHFYGISLTIFAIFYALAGGMLSIVWTDVIQYLIMTVSGIVIALIAMNKLMDSSLLVPDSWWSPFFSWNLEMDWRPLIPAVQEKIKSDGYELFSIIFMMMLCKGFLVSAAGPAPNFDMQKILSTKSPREGALMSGLVSVILLPTRYLMITGIAVLGILYFDDLNLMVNGAVDFEQLLPSAISLFVPTGLMGLLLAGLLAAFMSTFAGTLNAAQAYIVNDIYVKYVEHDPKPKKIAFLNYMSGLLIVGVSVFFGIFVKDINSVLQWLVSGLWGGYIAANVLKWYWWRFNGYGYFFGMIGGIIPALTFPLVLPGFFPELPEAILMLYFFPVLLAISFVGCLIGTYMFPSTEASVLIDFYHKVRPWGFWQPVRQMAKSKGISLQKNDDFKRDMSNVIIGVVWQTALTIVPIYLVLMQWTAMGIALGIAAVLSIVLKYSWFDRLPSEKEKSTELSEIDMKEEVIQ
ncbi:sodium:solute symporter family protein [Persicobacter psychrovividus]|uniref:Sodium:solute symporter n=1 Tax=Persicobacter psychrovividus TaxID=387638 RepID=A0ABN6LFT5_9BACT|nr:sodium:solute symporter [Persicobacter psychrovividus]